MKRFRIGRAAIVAAVMVVACNREKQPDAYGNIEATEVVVGAQATGQLASFTPVEGQVLASAAVAALVDTTALSLQLQQIIAQRATSVSRVGEVEKQVGVLETQRVIALRVYERTKRLFDQQAATAQQLDQAERDYKTLIAQIEAARAQEKTAAQDIPSTDARVAQIRDQINKARVVNPVGGTVLATYVKAGEIVQPGQPLYRIANLDTLELRAYVGEAQLSQVKLGQAVRVTVDAGKSARQTISGTVSWVSSQAEFTPTPIQTRDERSNLVYAVKIRVANRDGVLKIGMPADVELPTVVAAK
ncbi:MAG TPA: HlyD family efflux transporter periplasmic adaptor subunit [Gemmatimonadaceae bacterium]|jgi:HlyD family secretion protein